MRLTAGRLNWITPQWQEWEPEWDTTTGDNLPEWGGDEAINFRWAHSGELIHVFFVVSFSSNTDFGGGGAADNWRWTLPVPAEIVTQNGGFARLAPTNMTTERVGAQVRLLDTEHFAV